jgi:uncharacterized protein (DUF1015 family)
MDFRPFRGLRARKDSAARIASHPYDVLDSAEARRLAQGDGDTFLHVEKPEIDLPADIDIHDDRVYAKGRENLERLIADGRLVRDAAPLYSLYRIRQEDHAQLGIIGTAAVADYEADRIRKHEHTRPDKETDRMRHIDTLSAQAGPVLLAYRAVPELNAVMNAITARDPEVDFVADDGVEHAIWPVRDDAAAEKIAAILAKVPAAYIADGHHRAAAAARVAKERRRRGAAEGSPSDFFLAVLFPHSQLRIFGYHRLVRDLNGLDAPSFLDRLRQAGFDVRENHRTKRPPHRGTFGLYVAGGWYLLTPPPELGLSDDPTATLDVAILSSHVLAPILGIGDLRTDKRIDFVGGGTGKGVEELERRVGSGEHAAGFALYPTALEDVMKVADAGRVMPPKSTWFAPKLRSGLLVHVLD